MPITTTEGIAFDQGGQITQNNTTKVITIQTGGLDVPGRQFVFGTDGKIGSTANPIEGVVALGMKVSNAPTASTDVVNKNYVDNTFATEQFVTEAIDSRIPLDLVTSGDVDAAIAAAIADRPTTAQVQSSIDSAIAANPGGTAPAGAWTAPALQNNFANYVNSTGGASAGYRKVGSRVELRGLVAGGIKGQVIFTLPAAFRPKEGSIGKQLQLVGNVADKFATVLVRTTGEVLVSQHDAASLTWVSLNGISFPID